MIENPFGFAESREKAGCFAPTAVIDYVRCKREIL